MKGKIVIEGLKVFGYHGCLPQEKEQGQDFYVDLEIVYDMERAAERDDLEEAIDYDRVVREVHAIVSTERYDLLESLVARIGYHLLASQEAEEAMVRVRKPQAPMAHPVQWVGVEAHFTRNW